MTLHTLIQYQGLQYFMMGGLSGNKHFIPSGRYYVFNLLVEEVEHTYFREN